MKKYLLPSALILLLGLGVAIAQNITRAIQLSQDTTGAFSVDSNLGVYFPGHILSPGTNRPPVTVAGNTSPTITGTDTAGTITMGAAATTATATFGQAYLSVPACVVSSQTGSIVSSISYTTATGSLAITLSTGASPGNKINYFCTSVS